MTFQDLLDSFNFNEVLSNETVYKALLKKLKTDRITPVIGAGLSLWAGYPLWQSLLSRKATGTPVSQSVENLLLQSKFEQAASVLESFYRRNTFLQALKDEYSPEKICEKDRPSFQRLLPKLFTGPVVTTNYDVSLERLFNAPSVITPESSYQEFELQSAIQKNERVLVKLHGTIQDPTHLVLTNERYSETYGTDPSSPDTSLPIPNALSHIFHAAPPLFLGCGLGPDRTCAVLKSCLGVSGFALLELPQETENKDNPYHPFVFSEEGYRAELGKRVDQLDSMGVRVIWYPYGCHDAVSVLIHQLAIDCGLTVSEESSIETPDRAQQLLLLSTIDEQTIKKAKRREANDPTLKFMRKSFSWQSLVDKLYIEQSFSLRKSGKKCNGLPSLIEGFRKHNLMVSGKAGDGKSTALLYLFLKEENSESQIHYTRATTFTLPKNKLNNYQKAIRNTLEQKIPVDSLILIDGLEEAFADRYLDAAEFIDMLYSSGNNIWIACRSEFFEKLDERIDGYFDDIAEIVPWGRESFINYIKNLEDKTGTSNILERALALIDCSSIDHTAIYRPLFATVFAFLAIDETYEISSIANVYDLLDTFVSLWIKNERESLNRSNDPEYYIGLLETLAVEVYDSRRPPLPSDDSIIKELVVVEKYSSKPYVGRFYHREFCNYFIVRGLLDAALSGGLSIVKWYSRHYYNDVTTLCFIAFQSLTWEECNRIFSNFFSVYRTIYHEEPAVSIELSASIDNLDTLDKTKLKDEILYFALKIPHINPDAFIDFAYEHQDELMVKQCLAYVVTEIKSHPLILEFAKTLTPGTPEEILNRSWGICFFNDAPGNGYTYLDKGDSPWDNVRKKHCFKHLGETTPAAFRRRLLDYPLLYCYYFSREFKDCNSSDDLELIKNSEIHWNGYTKEEQQFVIEQKQQLVNAYEQQLRQYSQTTGINE